MILDGVIINRCTHCTTYCVIALDDLHHVLADGKRPQIACHHCDKLFSPGPDLNITDVDVTDTSDTTITGGNNPLVPDESATADPATGKAPDNAPPSSGKKLPLFLILAACSVAAIYWLNHSGHFDMSRLLMILE